MLCCTVADLGFDLVVYSLMAQVSANEERICLALEREAQSSRPEDADPAVQNAILLDIGRELGLDLNRNKDALFEQLHLLRGELVDCRDEGQIRLLETIESMFQSFTLEPAVPHWHTIIESAGSIDEAIPPFDTFLCPLSKQVIFVKPVTNFSDLMGESLFCYLFESVSPRSSMYCRTVN